jgi:hypothetical protein
VGPGRRPGDPAHADHRGDDRLHSGDDICTDDDQGGDHKADGRPHDPPPTTGPSTTPPTTVPTTVAGTLPPTTAGPAPASSTIPVEDTRPGEGKMPAWPLVLSGVGFTGAAAILGWHWMQTRPR